MDCFVAWCRCNVVQIASRGAPGVDIYKTQVNPALSSTPAPLWPFPLGLIPFCQHMNCLVKHTCRCLFLGFTQAWLTLAEWHLACTCTSFLMVIDSDLLYVNDYTVWSGLIDTDRYKRHDGSQHDWILYCLGNVSSNGVRILVQLKFTLNVEVCQCALASRRHSQTQLIKYKHRLT